MLTFKNSELRYRRLFEAAQEGIMILNAETGRIEDVNPYLIQMLGYSHAEFTNKELWEVGAFTDIEASQTTLVEFRMNATNHYENLALKTKDGQLVQVELVSNLYMVGAKKVIQCDIRNITARIRVEEQMRYQASLLKSIYDATVAGWSRALELRDKDTEGHTLRVTDLVLKLVGAFGAQDSELEGVRWGSLLHDVGKLGIPDRILHKPGPLTSEEWVLMKRHPTFAYEMLSPIRQFRLALDIPYCHHEKWDGSGYPRGLKGAQIPHVARKFAVVDVWDALTSERPYRAAWTKGEALEYIRTASGTHFDPQVVEKFMQIL